MADRQALQIKLDAIRAQLQTLQQEEETLADQLNRLTVHEKADKLIADAKLNPNKLYLWAPGEGLDETDAKLDAFFGGHITEEEGYFEATSELISLGRRGDSDIEWQIEDSYIYPQDSLLDIFGMKIQEWEAAGGGFDETYFHPQIDTDGITSDDIMNKNWDWDKEGGQGSGKLGYSAYWYTLLPTVLEGCVKEFTS